MLAGWPSLVAQGLPKLQTPLWPLQAQCRDAQVVQSIVNVIVIAIVVVRYLTPPSTCVARS